MIATSGPSGLAIRLGVPGEGIGSKEVAKRPQKQAIH
jgi:hypothetical protein